MTKGEAIAFAVYGMMVGAAAREQENLGKTSADVAVLSGRPDKPTRACQEFHRGHGGCCHFARDKEE